MGRRFEKNTVVELNEEEQDLCRKVAKGRFKNNRKSDVRNSKIGKQSNEFTDLEGCGGEFAFCKLLGVEPDTTISIRSAGNDVGDLIYKGKRIDVKTTKYCNGKLLAVPWKKKNVDVYVLMTGEFPRYTYRGYMYARELLKKSRLGDLGYGKTYMAEQYELLS